MSDKTYVVDLNEKMVEEVLKNVEEELKRLHFKGRRAIQFYINYYLDLILTEYCKKMGITKSSFIEKLLFAFFKSKGFFKSSGKYGS